MTAVSVGTAIPFQPESQCVGTPNKLPIGDHILRDKNYLRLPTLSRTQASLGKEKMTPMTSYGPRLSEGAVTCMDSFLGKHPGRLSPPRVWLSKTAIAVLLFLQFLDCE